MFVTQGYKLLEKRFKKYRPGSGVEFMQLYTIIDYPPMH